VPYWGLYLQSLDFSAADIGLLMSLFQISRMFAPNYWGWLADQTGKRVYWIRLTSFLGLFGFVAVFWVESFFWLFCVMAALSLFTSSTMPLAESLTLAHLNKCQRDREYSRIRMWGSLGFIIASIVLGYFIDHFSITMLLWFILLVQMSLVALTYALPEVKLAPHAQDHFSIWQVLKQPNVIALLIGCACMVTAHGVLYNFYSIYLNNHGYSKAVIGWLWSIGVICEIGVFWLMPYLMQRYSLKQILLASLILAVIRFALIGYAIDYWWVIVIAQTLHAATFGSFHVASVQIVSLFFTGRHQAKGQAIYNSVTYGFGGALGGIAGGFVLDAYGGQVTFMLSALFPLLGIIVIVLGLKLTPPATLNNT